MRKTLALVAVKKRSESPGRVQARLGGLRTSLVIAAVLYVLDALVLDQGVLAILAVLIVAVIRLPRAVLALVRAGWAAARSHALTVLIYVLMAVSVLGTKYVNDRIARDRADVVIAAVRQFELRHGRLPDRLEELAPNFLPSVPRAKYTLVAVFNSFTYDATPGRHVLMWTALPPFGRVTYNFEQGRWGHLD